MKRFSCLLLAMFLLNTETQSAPPAASTPSTPYGKERADVQDFIRQMVAQHAFVERELTFLFSRARREPAILAAIAPPKSAPMRSWQTYRGRFVNDARAAEGAEFFRSELEQYLLFAREQGLDVFSVKGSYAGAIGIPQFMPGSYRRFAVNFDGKGEADLRASPEDAIGSVANFLLKHGWQRGERVELPARVIGDGHRALLDLGIEPKTSLADLRRYGVETRSDLPLETPVALIELESPGAPSEYRLGLRNFYVLTRYNRSVLYASAVHDLAQEIRAKR